jgi:hypothetical protein
VADSNVYLALSSVHSAAVAPGTRLQESSVAPSILVIEELDDKKNGGGKAARRAAAREN